MEPVSESETIKEHQTNRANFIERSAEGQKCVRTDVSQQYHYFCHAEKKKFRSQNHFLVCLAANGLEQKML